MAGDPDARLRGNYIVHGDRILRRVVIDRSKPGELGTVMKATPEDVLLAAARKQRDGMSRDAALASIGVEVGKFGVTNAIAERAMELGRELLAKRIAQGLEPEESQITTLVEDDGGDDDE